MRALDSLTVCLTTFHRSDRLERALESVWRAGVRRVTIAAPDPDDSTLDTIASFGLREWISFDVRTTTEDVGCNATWLLAAYACRTKRLILLHDDDCLAQEFGEVYDEVIAPALDSRGAGFVSWNAELKHDDGKTEPCTYWDGPSTLMPSEHLLKIVAGRDRLSLSPVVSVLNRTILIRACGEAQETLRGNHSLERPGMLLGTEILVYMRHIQYFKRWLYLDKVLSFYGKHPGSGTVQAQKLGHEMMLRMGYNVARDQGSSPAPEPKARLLLVYSAYEPKDEETKERQRLARFSWDWHFNNSDVIELPFKGESLPKIRDILDYACAHALPEDIIVYANADAGLTTAAPERIIEGIKKGNGITCCANRRIVPIPGRLYKSVANCKAPGGVEVFAMTPAWWKAHRDRMPDMFIGREAWDSCLCALAEEWADGRMDVIHEPDDRLKSKAHTDDVCWHQEHPSEWAMRRTGESHQDHNRKLAHMFFEQRADTKQADLLK